MRVFRSHRHLSSFVLLQQRQDSSVSLSVSLHWMSNDGDLTVDEQPTVAPAGYSVRFDENIYTDRDEITTKDLDPQTQEDLPPTTTTAHRRRRRRSGILKRRENTLTTAGAPPIILSDEGLKAGRVSPWINFPLFVSMSLRSVGIIFGDM